MEIAGSYYFEGAAYLVVIQLVLIATLNLLGGRQHQLILGIIMLLFADAIRNSFLYNYLDDPSLKVIIGNLHLNTFFGPLVYAFMCSIKQPLNSRFFVSHFSFPAIYILGVLTIALLSYAGAVSIESNIYLYETKLTLFIIYFILTGRLVKSREWKNTRHKRRYGNFFLTLSIFFGYSFIIILFSKYFYAVYREWISYIFYVDVIFYIFTSIFLIYHGSTELNWLKKLFVSAYSNHDSDDRKTYDGIKSKLCELFEKEKIHTQMDLSLEELAKATGVKKHELSNYFSVIESKSFYDLINEKRIEEFKLNVLRPELKHLDILGIAHESGFSSKATFNRVFKKAEGKTPSEYLKEMKA